MSTLSLIPPRSKGLTTSSMTRTSVVLTPRQLAPTVGPAHAGVEILGGAQQGMEGFVSGPITRSQRGNLYIDDSHWGPEADSLKSGYWVPIGSIQIFIAKTNRSEPKPDLEVHVEISSQQHAGFRHTFVGFVTGSPEPVRSVEPLINDTSEEISDATSRPSDGSSTYAGSIRSVGSGRLSTGSVEYNPYFPYFEPPYCVSVFMANLGTRAQGSQGDQRAPLTRMWTNRLI